MLSSLQVFAVGIGFHKFSMEMTDTHTSAQLNIKIDDRSVVFCPFPKERTDFQDQNPVSYSMLS